MAEVFIPCIADREKVDNTAIRNGQLIICVDTGEIFLDWNNSRIQLLQGGTVVAEQLVSSFAIVNPNLQASNINSGGGLGKGIEQTPGVELNQIDDKQTDYSIV